MTIRCDTCKHWDRKNEGEGLCRRNAPSPSVLSRSSSYILVWPTTKPDDRCSEWQEPQIERQSAFDVALNQHQDRS
jgi:hypothetical protein